MVEATNAQRIKEDFRIREGLPDPGDDVAIWPHTPLPNTDTFPNKYKTIAKLAGGYRGLVG